MEARNRTLPDWFSRVRQGQIRLPRFQRFEAWTYQNVEGVLETALKGLPVGAVLILEVGEQELFRSRPIVGAPEGREKVSEHLLDGQQRLTALWRSLHADYEDRSYFVKCEQQEDGQRNHEVVSQGRWVKNGKKYPLWCDVPSELWERGLIPLEILRPDAYAEEQAQQWIRAVVGDNMERFYQVHQLVSGFRHRLATFNIPFLSLPTNTPAEVALDVFIQMNTSAQPLSVYDIVVAQVEAGTGRSLHSLADELHQSVPGALDFGSSDDLILAVGAFLQGQTPSKATFLSPGFAEHLVEEWDRIVDGIGRAIAFLHDEKVFDERRIPTDVVIPVIAALWSATPQGWDEEGRTRHLLRKYIWRAFFTDRYERSTSTRALADYKALRELLAGESEALPAVMDADLHPLPVEGDLIAAGWPKNKDRLGRAIMLAALRNGAYDLADGSPVSKDNLQRREYHHIFPVATLQDRVDGDREINRALNCVLVTWRTNRKISAQTPDEYIRARCEAAVLGEEEVKARLSSHVVPYEELAANDYEGFLKRRAEMMLPIIHALADGRAV